MSARTEVRTSVLCDSAGCRADIMSATLSISGLRMRARQAGWTRRHSGEIQIDLCPTCSLNWIAPEGTHVGGRPKKCRSCGETGGPYPNGDRPKSSSLVVSGCPACGWCY